MKAKISLVFGILMMISIVTLAQVKVENASSANIRVSSIDEKKSIEIAINNSAIVSFLDVENGVTRAKIEHKEFKPGKGFAYVKDGEFVLAVKDNRAVFTKPNQKQAKPDPTVNQDLLKKQYEEQQKQKQTKKTEKENEPEKTTEPETNLRTANFKVKNTFTKTITYHSEPFNGLCLKENATSTEDYETPTGNLQILISYDEDADSIATGKNRKWIVLDRSIPEGMTLLSISNSNLTLPNSGLTARKTLENETKRGFSLNNDEFKNGEYVVKTISPNSDQKIDFFFGWNVFSLQYKGENGFPVQAIIMFLVTEPGGKLRLTEKIVNGKPVFDIQ